MVQQVPGRSWVLPPDKGLDVGFLQISHRAHTENQKEDTARAQTLRKAQNTLGEPKVNPSYKSGSRAKTFNQTQAGSQWKMNRRGVESQTM